MADDQAFPCSLVIDIPFPTHRTAKAAIRTLSVDQELSALVKRDFVLVHPSHAPQTSTGSDPFRASILTNAAPDSTVTIPSVDPAMAVEGKEDEEATVLRTIYRATTNRMLRVAVNGFFESLNVVLQVIEELDTDVIEANGLEGLEGVQGVEQGMTGSTVTGG